VNDIFEQREQTEREDKQRAKQMAQQLRADVQEVMKLPAMQRTLMAFLQTAGIDFTAYRDNPTAMAHAAGWRDAGQWWLDVIRQHCPEREAQMRAEANKQRARTEAQDSNDDD
jgi:hypothetical protein